MVLFMHVKQIDNATVTKLVDIFILTSFTLDADADKC